MLDFELLLLTKLTESKIEKIKSAKDTNITNSKQK